MGSSCLWPPRLAAYAHLVRPQTVSKSFSFPAAGPVRTRIRLGWTEFRTQASAWPRQSRFGTKAGALIGLLFAACLSVFVILQALARRSLWFPSVQLSLWTIIAGYIIAFTLAGASVGALLPVLRIRIGAILGGILGGIVVYGILGRFAFGTVEVRGALSLGMAFGAPIGYLFHYESFPEKHSVLKREVLWLVSLTVVLGVAEIVLNS